MIPNIGRDVLMMDVLKSPPSALSTNIPVLASGVIFQQRLTWYSSPLAIPDGKNPARFVRYRERHVPWD